MNDKGQIAGLARGTSYSSDGIRRRIPGRGPLLWENNILYQLDDLLTPTDQRAWELTQVVALNNKGDILCSAYRKGESSLHMLLLTRPGSAIAPTHAATKVSVH